MIVTQEEALRLVLAVVGLLGGGAAWLFRDYQALKKLIDNIVKHHFRNHDEDLNP